MKIEIDFSSFRFKIITTLVVVVTLMSFFSFYTYNYYLSKKVYKNAESDIMSMLCFMKDQIIAIHDGRIIKPTLRQLDKDSRIIHSYLINSEGKVLYPSNYTAKTFDTLNLSLLATLPNDISLKIFQNEPVPFSRALIRLKNFPTCYQCHGAQ